MSQETNYPFGSHVAVTHRLVRRSEARSGGRRKVWKPEALYRLEYTGVYTSPKRIEEPVDVIVIGRRTLANGDANWGGYDDPITFTATEHFSAYLVVSDIRSAPFYVLAEHIVERAQNFEVGQTVEYVVAETSGLGVIISTSPLEGRETPYIQVLWGEDEDGWLTGGWELEEGLPLRVVDRPAPEIVRILVEGTR